MTEEHIRAHLMLSMIDSTMHDHRYPPLPADDLRPGQADPGKPVPQAAAARSARRTPIRADKSAIAYRRWLVQKGVTYGVIPAAA